MPDWLLAVFRLLAASDEASEGLGFGGETWVALYGEQLARLQWDYETWGFALSPDVACVQPKGRTPPVGCNLRSLSLHLSLLPPRQIVQTKHLPSNNVRAGASKPPHRRRPRRRPVMGALLVPFPYTIQDKDVVGEPVDKHWGHLRLGCSWAKGKPSTELAPFVEELINQCPAKVDLLVFPEVALSWAQLEAVKAVVQRRRVRLLVAGVHDVSGPGPGRNLAVGVLANARGGKSSIEWSQSKHHRWRVERWQVQNYGLPLHKTMSWWEDIDVSERAVVAARFVEGATVACLVCEDLARVEPVQPAIREMGVSLVVALLLDGPQRKDRWAAKSTTIFADDPGSSVLVLTSLALVRRSLIFRDRHEGSASPAVGLWQEPGHGAVEIPLRPDAHAVYFRLEVTEQEERTLDGRSDGRTAEVLRLIDRKKGSAFHSVVHPNAPAWAVPLYRTSP